MPSRAVVGIEIWLAAMTAFGVATILVPWVSNEFFNWIAFGDAARPDEIGADARDYLRFTFCLLGALTAGFGISMWFIAHHALRRGERWGWTAIVVSVGSWFVLDSVASIATGYPRNAAFNVALTLPAVACLWSLRPRHR